MKRYTIFLLLILSACFSRQTAMTRETYDAVVIGTPIGDLEPKIGEPQAVRSKGSDRIEYEYIEKIIFNGNYAIENNYFLEVLNGIVVGKRMTTERTPAYNFMYQSDPNFYPDFSPSTY